MMQSFDIYEINNKFIVHVFKINFSYFDMINETTIKANLWIFYITAPPKFQTFYKIKSTSLQNYPPYLLIK